MRKSKTKLAIGTALCFACLLSGCGNNFNDSAEIESLKAEIESLKETTVDTKEETTTTSATTVTTTATTTERTKITQATEPYGTYKGCTAVLEGATIVTDYRDNPAVVVEITFTNNSDENRSCGFTFAIDAFQDGIECETAYITDYDEFDTGTNATDIKPGVSLTVYKAYKLRNESSDVVVEVSGLYDFDNEVISRCTYHMQ